jgi:ferredoxin
MDQREWVKGRDSALCVPLPAGLRPASRCGGSRRCSACSFLLLQELSKERVIELVSTSSRADEESSIC